MTSGLKRRKGPELASLKSLKRKLDKVFSQWIRKRDALPNGIGICITCNRAAVLQAGHFIKRQHTAGRWDEHNAHGQCAGCNIREMALEHYEAIIKKYGLEEAQRVRGLRHQTWKPTRSELGEMIAKYSELA